MFTIKQKSSNPPLLLSSCGTLEKWLNGSVSQSRHLWNGDVNRLLTPRRLPKLIYVIKHFGLNYVFKPLKYFRSSWLRATALSSPRTSPAPALPQGPRTAHDAATKELTPGTQEEGGERPVSVSARVMPVLSMAPYFARHPCSTDSCKLLICLCILCTYLQHPLMRLSAETKPCSELQLFLQSTGEKGTCLAFSWIWACNSSLDYSILETRAHSHRTWAKSQTLLKENDAQLCF